MMDRNIKIAYALGFIRTLWFWLGIWVYFYLRFTNYAGIGLIETVLIVTFTLTEIPTGAFADLVGKKKTLIFSFAIQTIGNFLMAFAPNFAYLAFSVLVLGIGGTLYSGAFEALVYDSLKQDAKEQFFDKVLSRISSLSLAAMAIGGLLSGVLYTYDPRLPFVAVGVSCFVALVLCFGLIEPRVDSIKFSLTSFFDQNKKSLTLLGNLIAKERLVVLLVLLTAIYVLYDEMLGSVLAYEFGFSEKLIGVFLPLFI